MDQNNSTDRAVWMKFVLLPRNVDKRTHSQYHNKSSIGSPPPFSTNLKLVTSHNVKLYNSKIQSHCAHNKETFLMSGEQQSSVTFTTFQAC
jgi:hypothetical protein